MGRIPFDGPESFDGFGWKKSELCSRICSNPARRHGCHCACSNYIVNLTVKDLKCPLLTEALGASDSFEFEIRSNLQEAELTVQQSDHILIVAGPQRK